MKLLDSDEDDARAVPKDVKGEQESTSSSLPSSRSKGKERIEPPPSERDHQAADAVDAIERTAEEEDKPKERERDEPTTASTTTTTAASEPSGSSDFRVQRQQQRRRAKHQRAHARKEQGREAQTELDENELAELMSIPSGEDISLYGGPPDELRTSRRRRETYWLVPAHYDTEQDTGSKDYSYHRHDHKREQDHMITHYLFYYPNGIPNDIDVSTLHIPEALS